MNKTKSRILSAVAAFALGMSMLACMPLTASADSSTVAFHSPTGTLILKKGNIKKEDVQAYSGNAAVKSIVAEEGAVLPKDCSYMFSKFENVDSVSFQGIDTSNVENMSHMFSYFGTQELFFLDTSGFDTSNVTDMSYMYEHCIYPVYFGVYGFDTSKVTDMSGMFKDCWSLEYSSMTLENTTNVKSMKEMYSGCNYLEAVSFIEFDSSSVTDMSHMFEGCEYLESVYAHELWDTSAVVNSEDMFLGCECIKGGCGTVYDKNKTDIEYARIDSEEAPGYLTWGEKRIDEVDIRVIVPRPDKPAVRTVEYDKNKIQVNYSEQLSAEEGYSYWGTNYDIAVWFCGNTKMKDTDLFEEGKTYTCKFRITGNADNYYYVDSKTKVTVNGIPAEADGSNVMNLGYQYKADFVCKKHIHTPAEPVKENEKISCTEEGSYDEVVYCSECGEEISREKKSTAPAGHEWSEWKVTKEPTYFEEGIKEHTCSRCGTTETESIAKKALPKDLGKLTIDLTGEPVKLDPKASAALDILIERGDIVDLSLDKDHCRYDVNADITSDILYDIEKGTMSAELEDNDKLSEKYTFAISPEEMCALEYDGEPEMYSEVEILFCKSSGNNNDGLKLGDVNGDGRINSVDIAKVAGHIKGLKILTADERSRADVNKDGRIDSVDIAKIAAHIKGLKVIGS